MTSQKINDLLAQAEKVLAQDSHPDRETWLNHTWVNRELAWSPIEEAWYWKSTAQPKVITPSGA